MQLEVIPTRRPSGTSHPPTSRKPICPSGRLGSHGHLNLTSQPSFDRLEAACPDLCRLWLRGQALARCELTSPPSRRPDHPRPHPPRLPLPYQIRPDGQTGRSSFWTLSRTSQRSCGRTFRSVSLSSTPSRTRARAHPSPTPPCVRCLRRPQRQVPPPAMTGFIFEATHLVIDPASLFGPAALRACTPDQRVVTNEWLKESILTQDWAPEDLYEYQQPVELPAVASPGPGPPKEEPQDGSSRYAPPSPPCLSDATALAHLDLLALFSGVGVSKWKRWLPEEDDLLVRFLVPVVGKPNVKGTDGQDAFDRYAASGVSPFQTCVPEGAAKFRSHLTLSSSQATTRTALALRTRYYEHPRWYEETISKVRADLEQDADAQLMPSMTSEERESRIRRREEKRRAVERPPSEPK